MESVDTVYEEGVRGEVKEGVRMEWLFWQKQNN